MENFKKKLLIGIVILLCFTPLVWFIGKENFLIDGIDTNFPLNPLVWFERRFFVWQNILNAGSDFSSSTAGIFFHLVQVIPYLLGSNLTVVQTISLIFWFSAIIISSYFFARVFLPEKPYSQLIFIIFYSFNIYLFNSWENVKVANLSLMTALPLAFSTLILLRERKISFKKAFFYSTVTGVFLSGSGINPAYFVTFFLCLLIYFIVQISISKNSLMIKEFFLVSFSIIAINSFWILPTFFSTIQNIPASGSIGRIGFNNWVDSLSENASLLNIMRLLGAWDWYSVDSITGFPLYISYSVNYFHKLPFITFSFFIPALVIISLIFFKKEKTSWYLTFGLMFIMGVFLCAGTHLPTGFFYRWLTTHIPYFTLFRSPWYIFAPLVVLSSAVLVGLLFFQLEDRYLMGRFTSIKLPTILTLGLFLVLTTGNLFYSYPLVTGKIFRPNRPDSFYVRFPSYVFEAGKWLNKQKKQRIAGYPDDEIEKFEWGYRGIESILELLSDQEIFYQPLNGPDSAIAKLMKKFYLSLKKGEIDEAQSLGAKLGLNLIFTKQDQLSLSTQLSEKTKTLEMANFGKWHFYKFPYGESLPLVYSSKSLFFGSPSESLEKVIGSIDASGLILNEQDTQLNKIPNIYSLAGKVILAKNNQQTEFANFQSSPSTLKNRLVLRDPSKVDFDFDIPRDGDYQPVLERYHLEDFGIDPSKKLSVDINGQPANLEVSVMNDSYVYFKNTFFSKGKYRVSLKLRYDNLILDPNLEKEDSFNKEGSGDFFIEDSPQGRYLSILNKSTKDISADFKPSNFDPFLEYLVQFKYQQIYGNNASVLISQYQDQSPVKQQVERLPNYPEWSYFSAYFDPDKTDSQLKIALVAPQTRDPLGTKVRYNNLSLYKVFSNNLILINKSALSYLSNPEIDYQIKSPVKIVAKIKNAQKPHLIVFSENYSPFWQVKLTDQNNRLINNNPIHFSVNLFANGWYIPGGYPQYNLVIFFYPQYLYWIGLGISSLVLILSVSLVIMDKLKTNGEKSV